MKFSIIIPSFNQEAYLEETLKNGIAIKNLAGIHHVNVELLMFDSNSNDKIQKIIKKYENRLDVLRIEKYSGEFEAVNEGIKYCTGDYWTCLKIGDLINVEGFYELVTILKQNKDIDYIYGGVDFIDADNNSYRAIVAKEITLKKLLTRKTDLFSQGAFFRKSFTDGVGWLKNYRHGYHYEYVLRSLKVGAKVYACKFNVASSRQATKSNSKELTYSLITDQLIINKQYGRKWYHFLTWFSQLRLLKHKLPA